MTAVGDAAFEMINDLIFSEEILATLLIFAMAFFYGLSQVFSRYLKEIDVKLSELDKAIKREEKEKVKSIEDQKKVLSKTVKRMYSKSSDTSYIG